MICPPPPPPSPLRGLRLSWLVALLAGCEVGWDANGRWHGDCAIEEDDGPTTISFHLKVHEPEPGTLDGEGEFLYHDHDFSGPLSGERYAEAVSLSLDGNNSRGHATRLDIVGNLDDDRILGDCAFYGVQGALDMARAR